MSADVPPPRRRRRARRVRASLALLVAFAVTYALIAYLAIPWLWRRDERRHPALADAPTLTHTADHIPGDPINVALVGDPDTLDRAMRAAGWRRADPITLANSLRIVADVIRRRPYVDAPVSNLYLWGRKEDVAFEKPVGDDPRRRHHVRCWRSAQLDDAGRPMWLGAATFDTRVGFSHDTGQVTHHIAPEIDADRDLLIADLRAGGALESAGWVDDFQPARTGRNGGGDPWRTDGRLAVGVIVDGRRDDWPASH